MYYEKEIRTKDVAFIKSIEDLLKQLINKIEEEGKDSEESRLNHYLTIVKILLSQIFDNVDIDLRGTYKEKNFRYFDYIDKEWFNGWKKIQGW
jgi:hypothetical protein